MHSPTKEQFMACNCCQKINLKLASPLFSPGILGYSYNARSLCLALSQAKEGAHET